MFQQEYIINRQIQSYHDISRIIFV